MEKSVGLTGRCSERAVQNDVGGFFVSGLCKSLAGTRRGRHRPRTASAMALCSSSSWRRLYDFFDRQLAVAVGLVVELFAKANQPARLAALRHQDLVELFVQFFPGWIFDIAVCVQRAWRFRQQTVQGQDQALFPVGTAVLQALCERQRFSTQTRVFGQTVAMRPR
jgi:hypothetical protein